MLGQELGSVWKAESSRVVVVELSGKINVNLGNKSNSRFLDEFSRRATLRLFHFCQIRPNRNMRPDVLPLNFPNRLAGAHVIYIGRFWQRGVYHGEIFSEF